MFLLVACSEYDLEPEPLPSYGPPNPPSDQSLARTDVFLQVQQPEVDVLWIIDHSGSMGDNRAQVAAAFPSFLGPFLQLEEVEWHIGVVTTDMETPGHEGALQARSGYRWIDATTVDPVGVFEDMLLLDDTEALRERGRDAAWTATELLRDTANEGFLHDSPFAWLHFTVVTDEDDASVEITEEQFVDYVNFVRPYASRSSFNSVVAMVDTGTERPGTSYLALTEALGGVATDIHTDDWGVLLGQLGVDQAPKPIVEFFLTAQPQPETIAVTVVDPSGVTFTFQRDVDWAWSEIRNSITFLELVPPLGSTVRIDYLLETVI